jgi:hypothetical protein
LQWLPLFLGLNSEEFEIGIAVLIAEDASSPIHHHLYLMGKPESGAPSVECDLLEINFGSLLLQPDGGKRIEQKAVETDYVKLLRVYPCDSLDKDQSAAFVSNEIRHQLGSLRPLREGDNMCFVAIEHLRPQISEICAAPVGGMEDRGSGSESRSKHQPL